LSGAAEGFIRNVGVGQTYSTIRAAVDHAAESDTVYIHDGIYREGSIRISKSLNLLGEKNTILDGEDKYEILTITANNFFIRGITFRNSGFSSMDDFAALKIDNSSQVTIENNTFINTCYGVHFSGSSYLFVRGNTFLGTPKSEQNSGNGIHLWKCSRANIANNLITGHRDGIYFEFVDHSNIINNVSRKNIRYGLHFMFSNDDTYQYNNFSENGGGVAVMFSKRVDMIGNTFEHNRSASSYGILLKDITDGNISRNVFNDNTIGIYMEGTARIHMDHNRFANNGWGFRILANCADITVVKNNFSGNTFDVSTNGTLVLNTFRNNYWDKYEGYDLNKDGIGDIPYHPTSLFSTIAEEMPYAMMLYRSFTVMILERTEKAIPAVTPENLVDKQPAMKPNS
jgi:nitrous oxidase accessory protein